MLGRVFDHNASIGSLENESDMVLSHKHLEAILFAICIFLLAPPFFIWNSINPIAFILICSLLALRNLSSFDRRELLVVFILFFTYLYIPLTNDANIVGIIVFMSVLTLFIVSPDFLKKVFWIYVVIYSLSLIPSIIVYISVNFLGIEFPNSIIDPLNELKEHNYIQYPFLVESLDLTEIVLPRFCGYYDEPGVVGTISAVILLSSRFNLKKIINIPVLAAGILSFSFAFYLITLVYLLFFIQMKYKVLITAIVITVVILLSDNEILDNYVFSRFKYENGSFTGDNRLASEDFNNWYKQYRKSKDFYFGLGTNSNLKYNYGGSSYKDVIINYGIIFFALVTGLFVIRAFYQISNKKNFFIYLLILATIIYPRPYITQYFYIFLIVAPIPILAESKSNEQSSRKFIPNL